MKAKVLLSFDIEEFDLPEEFGVPVTPEEKISLSREGTEALLTVVETTAVPATFFITGKFAAACPDLVERMVRGGHEIASHGMDHSHFAESDLAESKQLLEKLSGQSVTGFRMARLAPVTKEAILQAEYIYESSLNPVFLPGRYNHFTKPLKPFREACGLWQLPVSAVPYVRFPLFWLSFKNLPLPLYEMLALGTLRSTGIFNFYSHPWEYTIRSSESRWGIPRYIVRHAGWEQIDRLSHLLRKLQTAGEFVTFQQFLTTSQG